MARPQWSAWLVVCQLLGCSALIDSSDATFRSADGDAVATTPVLDESEITAAGTRDGDNFGAAISLEDDEMLATAPTADLSGVRSAVDGSCGELVDVQDAGRIYGFVRDVDGWREDAELRRETFHDAEGLVRTAAFTTLPRISLARENDTLVVGFPAADYGRCDGVDVPEIKQAGKVMVFERAQAGNWVATAVLRSSAAAEGDFFGSNVALRGDELFASGAVGSELKDSGTVHVFQRADSGWNETQLIEPSNPITGAYFGSAISVDGDALAVGSWLDGHGERGVDGEPVSEQVLNSGAAYVFRERDGQWQQEAYIKAVNRNMEDVFGMSIAIENDTLLVGAPGESGAHKTIDARDGELDALDDNGANGSGAVYIYRRGDQGWSLDTYLKAFAPRPHMAFGVGLAVHGGRVLVGAPYRRERLSKGEDELADVGAAYLFDRDFTPLAQLQQTERHSEALFGFAVALSDRFAAVGAPDNFDSPGGGVTVFDLTSVINLDE